MTINTQTKKLTKKELHKLLVSAKKKADQMPKEKGSFRLEVVCLEDDIK